MVSRAQLRQTKRIIFLKIECQDNKRLNPKTVLRQDTLLLNNPKECGERKKACYLKMLIMGVDLVFTRMYLA